MSLRLRITAESVQRSAFDDMRTLSGSVNNGVVTCAQGHFDTIKARLTTKLKNIQQYLLHQ